MIANHFKVSLESKPTIENLVYTVSPTFGCYVVCFWREYDVRSASYGTHAYIPFWLNHTAGGWPPVHPETFQRMPRLLQELNQHRVTVPFIISGVDLGHILRQPRDHLIF